MLKLTTCCENCAHSNVCKYKGNPEYVMSRLKESVYGEGHNKIYPLEVMLKSFNIDVTLSCPNYN